MGEIDEELIEAITYLVEENYKIRTNSILADLENEIKEKSKKIEEKEKEIKEKDKETEKKVKLIASLEKKAQKLKADSAIKQ